MAAPFVSKLTFRDAFDNPLLFNPWSTMATALQNSLHLWLCSEPAESKQFQDQGLTLYENVEREQLVKSAYFGSRSYRTRFRTLDLNLPPVERSLLERNASPFMIRPPKIGPTKVGIGLLDQLLPEILDMVISSLDMATLDQFKATSRRNYELVNAHPQFKDINLQAYDTIRALRAIKTGHLITLEALFNKLCGSQCNECGDFGGYLYLLTFQRVCCRCFMENDRYCPLQEMNALKTFGLSPDTLRALPRSQSYSGYYGGMFGYKTFNTILIDRESAYNMGIALHGSLSAIQKYVANTPPSTWKSYKKEIDAPQMRLAAQLATKRREQEEKWYAEHKNEALLRTIRPEERTISPGLPPRPNMYHKIGFRDKGFGGTNADTHNTDISTFDAEGDRDEATKHEIDQPLREESRVTKLTSNNDPSDCESEDGWINLAVRYMAIIRVPWLNRRTRREEWGFRCIGCEGNTDWPNHARRDFIMLTFKEHLKELGPIRDGMHHINDCCERGTCKKMNQFQSSATHEDPFWRC